MNMYNKDTTAKHYQELDKPIIFLTPGGTTLFNDIYRHEIFGFGVHNPHLPQDLITWRWLIENFIVNHNNLSGDLHCSPRDPATHKHIVIKYLDGMHWLPDEVDIVHNKVQQVQQTQANQQVYEGYSAHTVRIDQDRDLHNDKTRLVWRLHCHLTHPNEKRLWQAAKSTKFEHLGLTKQDIKLAKLSECKHCIQHKNTQYHPRGDTKNQAKPGQQLHVDLAFIPHSQGEYTVIVAVDSATGFGFSKILENKKSETVTKAIRMFKGSLLSNGHVLQRIHSDNEATFRAAREVMREEGVEMIFTPPYTHERVSERFIRTLKSALRVTAAQSPIIVEKTTFPYLLQHCTDTVNMLCNSRSPKEPPAATINPRLIKPSRDQTLPIFAEFGFARTKSDNTIRHHMDEAIYLGEDNIDSHVGTVVFNLRRKMIMRTAYFKPYPPTEYATRAATEIFGINTYHEFNQPRDLPTSQHTPNVPRPPPGFPTTPAYYPMQFTTPPHMATSINVSTSTNPINTSVGATSTTTIASTEPTTATTSVEPTTTTTSVEPTTATTSIEPTTATTSVEPTTATANAEPTTAPLSMTTSITTVNMSSQEASTNTIETYTDQTQPQETQQEQSVPAHQPTSMTTQPSQFVQQTSTEQTTTPSNNPSARTSNRLRIKPRTDFKHLNRTGETRYIHTNNQHQANNATQPSTQYSIAPSAEEQVLLDQGYIESDKRDHNEQECVDQADMDELKRWEQQQAIKVIHKQDIPNNKKPLPSKLFNKNLYDSLGKLERSKSRLVAGGHRQQVPDCETSTVNIDMTTICVFICIVLYLGLSVKTYDVSNAFLIPRLNEEEYIRFNPKVAKKFCKINPQYKQYLDKDGALYAKLQAAVYGLKQASAKFQEFTTRQFARHNFFPIHSNKSVFKRELQGDKFQIILSFVDDFMLLSPPENDDIHAMLTDCFGKITCQTGNQLDYLGMRFMINPTSIKINQPAFLREIVNDLCDDKDLPTATPHHSNLFDIVENSKPLDATRARLYRSTGMKLSYAAQHTRPDLKLNASHVSMNMNTPSESDLSKLKLAARYVKGTLDDGLTFHKDDIHLHGYADASYGIHPQGRGQIAHMFYLTSNRNQLSAPVSTLSKKTDKAAQSSTEAEACATLTAKNQAIYIRSIMQDVGMPIKEPTSIGQDNTSAITILTRGPGWQGKSRPWERKLFTTTDAINDGIIKLEYVPSLQLPADAITKPLTPPRFEVWKEQALGQPTIGNTTSRV